MTDVTGLIRQLMSKNGTVFGPNFSIVPSELADFRVPFWINSERDNNKQTNKQQQQQTDEHEKSETSTP